MTVRVNLHEAKAHLSRLLERAASGERVVICKADHPIADLVPHRPTGIVLGGLKGELVWDDDSFGELDPDIQRMFYGEDEAAP